MFQVTRCFHATHVVYDFDAAARWYEDVFAARSSTRRDGTEAELGVTDADVSHLRSSKLAVMSIGSTVMMPLDPAPEVGTGRFRQRMGARLHSLALFVDDPGDLIEHLHARGLVLLDDFGQPDPPPDGEIWTRPRQAPLVFEFFGDLTGVDGALDPAPPDARTSDDHPLIADRALFTCVTAERDDAAAFLVDGLHGSWMHETTTPYGTRSTFVELGDQVVIELAEPLDDESRAAADLAIGATFHAVTFRVRDLAAAVEHLAERGVSVESVADGHAVTDPASTFGVVFRFIDRDIADWSATTSG